jgi:hypothetical protein
VNFNNSASVEVTKEFIAVTFDLHVPGAEASLERHIHAFPAGYTEVEKIADDLVVLRIYPGGAKEII